MERVIIQSRLPDAARPTFLGMVAGQPIKVMLDTSARSALITDADGGDLDTLLDLRRGLIAQTAERLHAQGFYSITDDGIEMVISALDLDPR